MSSAKIPPPQGNYRPAMRHGDVIYTSGMTPRRDGVLQYEGKVRASDPPEMHREAVEIAVGNALAAASSMLGAEEQIGAILNLQVFVNAEPDFTAHPRIADFASAWLADALGAVGIGARAAVGVASLPSDAPVEITLCASVVVRDQGC